MGYSPVLGRFLSADTIVPSPTDPQQLNRYAYTRNNPVKYIDPSGHAAICGTATDSCGDSWLPHPVTQAPPGALDNAWNFSTGLVVAVASIPFEVVDYAATAIQCVTSGCTLADVALTAVPGAIGPVARQVDNVLDIAKAAENAGDAVKAVENGSDAVKAVENGSDAATALHKNALDYVGDTHVYRIKGPDGSTYKIGQSAQGVRQADGMSIRAEKQVRRLQKATGQQFASEIRKVFLNKRSAYEYENRLIERFRRRYGEDSLPGNLNNH